MRGIKMKIRQLMACLFGVFLTLLLTACTPTKPTNTTVTTTFFNINTTTKYPSTLAGTTTTHTRTDVPSNQTTINTTSSQGTTILCYSYPQEYKTFTTIEDYCNFVKTADEQTLRSIFTKKEYDGSLYFKKETFEIILQDRQYLLPVIPTGYMFKGIRLRTLDPMAVILEREAEEYAISCFMNRTEKILSVEEDDSFFKQDGTFFKQDGTKVTVVMNPDISLYAGGGTCYWEENGYQCFIRFTKENKKQVWDLVKAFELKIVSIE